MQTATSWLSLAIWIPIGFGVAILAAGRDRNPDVIRTLALIGSLLGLVVTIPLYTGFDPSLAELQFVENVPWIERLNANYHLGVDGISIWFVLLTAFMTVIVVLAGWEVIETRVSQYYAAFLILSGLMVGVFAAADGLLFFVFFEATLVPMYMIIGIWGGPNRIYAAIKFFLYTFAGSLLMLVALVYLYYASDGRFGIFDWHQIRLGMTAQILLFLAFFAAFAVKVPMWPVHTWLPDAHVEAPTGGSIILAAIMLKLGAYGFLRFSLPIAPDASHALAGFVIALSLIAVVYIGFVALVQSDMKKARCVFVDRAHGLRDARLFHLQPDGNDGRDRADDLARLRLRRDVLLHRRDVRPHALPRDRGLRRGRQHDAASSPRSSCCS